MCTEVLATRQAEDPPTHDLTTLIATILRKINFIFGDQHYLQIYGTAMGTRMAPSYANLFMAKLERSLLSRPTTSKPLVWWRYIDEIFALWTHGEEALKEFIDDLNTAHSTIKFTSEWSHAQIHFLDVLVSLKAGVLSTDLYTKETDTHQYHALCIRRICSSDNDFRRHLDNLHSHLVHRGYESSFIKRQLRHIHSIRRTDLLTLYIDL